MLELLKQGGVLAVAAILYRVATELWSRYKKREDGHRSSLERDGRKLLDSVSDLQERRAVTIDDLHREYADKMNAMERAHDEELSAARKEIAKLQERRVADQQLIVRAAVAQADLAESLRDVVDATKASQAAVLEAIGDIREPQAQGQQRPPDGATKARRRSRPDLDGQARPREGDREEKKA